MRFSPWAPLGVIRAQISMIQKAKKEKLNLVQDLYGMREEKGSKCTEDFSCGRMLYGRIQCSRKRWQIQNMPSQNDVDCNLQRNYFRNLHVETENHKKLSSNWEKE